MSYVLFLRSAEIAKTIDGNCSVIALAGIPPLLSALRCLMIEVNAGMIGGKRNQTALDLLAKSQNDLTTFAHIYGPAPELDEDLKLLQEVRNEILHPSHMPAGTVNNTPLYLAALREKQLLQSTGRDPDYDWLSQLQSHRLFYWAFEIVAECAAIVIDSLSNRHPDAVAHKETYFRFKAIEV